jgi:hypothetical protein
MTTIRKPVLFDAEARNKQFPRTFPREDKEALHHWFNHPENVSQKFHLDDPITVLVSSENYLIWVKVQCITNRANLIGVVTIHKGGELHPKYPIGTKIIFQERHILRRATWYGTKPD